MRTSLNLETRNLRTSKQGHVSRLWQSLNYPPFRFKRNSFLLKARKIFRFCQNSLNISEINFWYTASQHIPWYLTGRVRCEVNWIVSSIFHYPVSNDEGIWRRTNNPFNVVGIEIKEKKLHRLKLIIISNSTLLIETMKYFCCPSRWLCGLRRRTISARFLGLWVQIPPGAWMCFFFMNAVCCTGTALCDGPIPRVGESYRVCVNECDLVQQ